MPMVGDTVSVSVKNGKGSIDEILPRTTMLIRPAVANIDQLVVVVALRSPEPHAALIDHFLILGEHSGIETVLCFNKADLPHTQELVDIYRKRRLPRRFDERGNGRGRRGAKKFVKG